MSRPRRFPAAVYSRGEEPDARFTLANERTYLAWIRTALALLASGVALELLGLELQPGMRLAASLVLILTGAGLPIVAWIGWMQAERALRENRALPSSLAGVMLGVTVVVAGLLLILAILLQ